MPPNPESPAVGELIDAMLDNLSSTLEAMNAMADNMRKDQFESFQAILRSANQTAARNIRNPAYA